MASKKKKSKLIFAVWDRGEVRDFFFPLSEEVIKIRTIFIFNEIMPLSFVWSVRENTCKSFNFCVIASIIWMQDILKDTLFSPI